MCQTFKPVRILINENAKKKPSDKNNHWRMVAYKHCYNFRTNLCNNKFKLVNICLDCIISFSSLAETSFSVRFDEAVWSDCRNNKNWIKQEQQLK